MHIKDNIPIGVAAQMLGVSIQTLRRWDESGVFASHRVKVASHRYYTEDAIEDFLSRNYKYLASMCRQWSLSGKPPAAPSRFYCSDRSIFQARLSKLELLLSEDQSAKEQFPIISSIVGEIGNNSFDHNLGNWPDVSGIVFCYSLGKKEIILADRGQGVLATLKRVKRGLVDHAPALRTAFTEIISGRAPEARGNGLKYVKAQVENYDNIQLYFQSGDAYVKIKERSDLIIHKANDFNRGCFAKIHY